MARIHNPYAPKLLARYVNFGSVAEAPSVRILQTVPFLHPVAWAEEFPGKMTWLPFVPKSIGVDAE